MVGELSDYLNDFYIADLYFAKFDPDLYQQKTVFTNEDYIFKQSLYRWFIFIKFLISP